jgi:hypothetical protein
MSSTQNAAPLKATTIIRDCADRSSRRATTVASVFAFSFGNCCRVCAAIRFISARAASSVTPDLSLATE